MVKRKAFTLVELIVAVIIIGIVATISIPIYQNVVEDAKAKLCQADMLVGVVAVDRYAMDHDMIPATLSLIPEEYFKNAYVEIFQKNTDWKLKLAQLIVNEKGKSLAYATTYREVCKDCLATCPVDSTVTAYHGINQAVLGMAYRDFINLGDNTLIITETSNVEHKFESSTIKKGHKKKKILTFEDELYAVGICKSRNSVKIKDDGNTVDFNNDAIAVTIDITPSCKGDRVWDNGEGKCVHTGGH